MYWNEITICFHPYDPSLMSHHVICGGHCSGWCRCQCQVKWYHLNAKSAWENEYFNFTICLFKSSLLLTRRFHSHLQRTTPFLPRRLPTCKTGYNPSESRKEVILLLAVFVLQCKWTRTGLPKTCLECTVFIFYRADVCSLARARTMHGTWRLHRQ